MKFGRAPLGQVSVDTIGGYTWSVDMSANTQLTNSQDVTGHVGQHVSRYVDWESVDISINRPPTFGQYFDDTWLTLLLDLHFLHVSSNFCCFHWQGIDLSNVKKTVCSIFSSNIPLHVMHAAQENLHSYLIEEAQSSRGYELWFVVRLLKWVALLNILWPTVCSYILVLKLCCMMVNCNQYSTNSWPIFC